MQRCFVAFLLAVVFINICSLTPICPINEEWNICGQFCEPACGPPATPSIICHEIVSIRNYCELFSFT
ncbi:hypothetical protein QLX08_003830 [Tetragonisca angustula]|uniref:Uncharacterized protein n=1 Tax=Tetragonisca angustula TaxID=166442 RepID=A0AAW1A4W5_9HYME